MNKTFSYKCDTDTLNALKRITGLTYIDNKVFQSVVSTLITRIGNPRVITKEYQMEQKGKSSKRI